MVVLPFELMMRGALVVDRLRGTPYAFISIYGALYEMDCN